MEGIFANDICTSLALLPLCWQGAQSRMVGAVVSYKPCAAEVAMCCLEM